MPWKKCVKLTKEKLVYLGNVSLYSLQGKVLR